MKKITQTYPCITTLSKKEKGNSMWSDGPLENNIRMDVLALDVRSFNPDFIENITTIGNLNSLTVYINQMKIIFRPF